MPRLLLTRANAQAQAFAAELHRATCLEAVIAPMQEMRDLPVEIDLTGIEALAFTSKNGVAAFARQCPHRLPAYCVGPSTAEAARALGFTARAATGDAKSLQRILPPSGVLHVHGVHVRQELGNRGLAIYEQVALPLAAFARNGIERGELRLAAVFSPRSAELLADALPPALASGMRVYGLSAAVAAAWPYAEHTRICPEPSARSMLRLLSADFPA